MTSVLNTNASLPYSHDLFESLIVKKRIKVMGWPPLCLRHSELGMENSTPSRLSIHEVTIVRILFLVIPHVFEKYTHLQINLVFTRDSTESLVYDILQLNVLHTGHLMFQLARYSRYRSIFS
ncbi:hypothetical protein T265_15022, partial [Opisthorchis viverrini]